MTTDVTSHGELIDQRGMTADERLELAAFLRGAWWDCYREFMRSVVDLDATGLTPASLDALAADLDEAGYTAHAVAIRRMNSHQVTTLDRTHDTRATWRPRIHRAAAVRAAH